MPGSQTVLEEMHTNVRAYILLRTVQGKSDQVVTALRGMPGVAEVDLVEGPPDVVLVVEASARQDLARYVVEAVGAVETMTEDLSLLPARC